MSDPISYARSDADMLRTFRMGIGLTVVRSPKAVEETLRHLADHQCACAAIGNIAEGDKRVGFRGTLSW